MKQLKSFFKKNTASLLTMALFAYMGAYVGRHIAHAQELNKPYDIFWLLVSFFLGHYLQITIHEAGHLIFGLITGYRFLSFRVASLMILKTPNGIRFRRYHVPGTGGQCVLEPPSRSDGKQPFILMLAGGVIANLLFSLILWLLNRLHLLPDSLALPIILLGNSMIVTNGIPYKTILPNDAYTIYELSRDKNLLEQFYMELKRYQLSLEGLSYAQMPEDLFLQPSTKQLEKSAYQSTAVAYFNRLADQENYDTALAYGLELLESPNLLPIFKPLISMTVIICQLLLEQPVTVTIDKKGEQILKALEKYEIAISTYRYAVALLQDKDVKAADQALLRFEKLAPLSILPGTLSSERRLLTAIQQLSQVTDTVQE